MIVTMPNGMQVQRADTVRPSSLINRKAYRAPMQVGAQVAWTAQEVEQLEVFLYGFSDGPIPAKVEEGLILAVDQDHVKVQTNYGITHCKTELLWVPKETT
jgi:hypothetical protein